MNCRLQVNFGVDRYRRGKPYSNDVDIVIGHPEFFTSWERQQELARQFLVVLYGKGVLVKTF